MLNIQKYISKHGLEKTVSDFSLKTSETDDLILLNYNQIDSPKTPETNECRGLILEKEKYDVVFCGFYRFFNVQEECAEDIDFSKAIAEIKHDGSLIGLYWWNGEWHVSTRGMPLASGQVGDNSISFAQLFWETAPKKLKAALEIYNKEMNLFFELVGPMNRIVTKYDKAELYLLGGRNTRTLEEQCSVCLDIFASNVGIKRPKEYKCSSLDDLVKMFKDMHPTEEGFVVIDKTRFVNGNYPRVKVKNPAYIALHHSIGAGGMGYMSYKNIIKLWKLGETAEVKASFPEYAEKIESVELTLNHLDNEATIVYTSISQEDLSQKEFAMRIKDLDYKHILFALRNGKVDSARQYLIEANEDNLLSFIKETKCF